MYSLLEALPSPEEIVLRAKELGQTAVGIADKGYTYGLIEFWQEAKKQGMKPILGMETFVAARTRFDKESGIDSKSYPITLLATSNEGYQNLLQLATFASLEGMYYKPRVDADLLQRFGKGLTALTGPLGGAIPQAALAEDGDRLVKLTEQYQGFFGKENVYFELMDLPNVRGQAEVNQQLIHWGKKLGVPTVATCNSFYCRPDDAEAHDVLLCIQKNANVNDTSRFSLRDSDFSMRPYDALERAFAHVPEALENTRVIADRCTVEWGPQKYHIPRFETPKKKTESQYLRELCEEGLSKRYATVEAVHRERLEHELSIIDAMGFSGYFLIVADFVNEAKRRGITVGPGRGSAAGSIVSYCLNITTLDPLEHGLIFERFLNPERITMPDIDTDFADNRRDEVLEYVRKKYGEDRVVQICTFGTLAARAAVKDVGRAFGIPFLEMNALAKLIPERPGTTLDEALGTQELKNAYDTNTTYRTIIDTARRLEGITRHVSVHACGVIISPEDATTYTALQRAPKDDETIITQYGAKPLEALGLLKMDFLGLTNLTVIQTALEIIKRTREKDIDISRIPLDDKATYALLQRGDTTGVFQLESAGMRRYLRQLKPTVFGDITAMAALYRPGPMEWIPSYIKRKHKQEKIEYLHGDVEEIFRETYGIGVYQEQILQLARSFAGYTLGEADILRKAIGKKIKKELDAQHEKFIKGAVAKGYGKSLAEKIFSDVIMPFAGYGFPKAHAACYARIAYETAYLKANYAPEFMAALLSSEADDTERVMIEIEECRSMNIAVLPPDINESRSHFTVVPPAAQSPKLKAQNSAGWSIRFGLSAVKGVGGGSVEQIIVERERGGRFSTIEDFARRVPAKLLNKKLLESLGKSGAFDSIVERRAIVEHFDAVTDYRKSWGGGEGQGDLFGAIDGGMQAAAIEFPPTPPATPQQKLQWEKETLGMYVSSHPLAGLKKYIGKKAQLLSSLSPQDAGRKVTVAGIVENIKRIQTKKGETMAIVTIEDPTGKIEVTLFPRTFVDAAAILEQPDSVLVIGGALDLRGGALQVRADAVKRASLSTMIERAKEEGFFDEEEARRGLQPPARLIQADGGDAVEAVDEEGNVIAGERLHVTEETAPTEEFFGPLSLWMMRGMPVEEVLRSLGLSGDVPADLSKAPVSPITIHTIVLPQRAPKQLLLDLKKVLQTFPGPERVQLSIDGKLVPLSLTVSMSTVLQKKIDDVLAAYACVEQAPEKSRF
ncbi:MAG: DNA polymerase III subunit alpha [Candidatus Peregrinibacteria bacterium Gr01-1014_25]|nr:MAG: DNA polymerase III subunit alpha [Candidatus Peregrinibacteria bacterium Gr01-1014_25]